MKKIKVKSTESAAKRLPKNRLRELRDRSRLTQEEVATLLGYDHTTVSRHESGDRALDAEDIKKYSRLFKCESYELFLPAVTEASA